jgi:hypothetical protein
MSLWPCKKSAFRCRGRANAGSAGALARKACAARSLPEVHDAPRGCSRCALMAGGGARVPSTIGSFQIGSTFVRKSCRSVVPVGGF